MPEGCDSIPVFGDLQKRSVPGLSKQRQPGSGPTETSFLGQWGKISVLMFPVAAAGMWPLSRGPAPPIRPCLAGLSFPILSETKLLLLNASLQAVMCLLHCPREQQGGL